MRNYYQILEVRENVSQAELKKAYKNLVKKYHPDVAKNSKIAEEKIKELNVAYDVLSVPEERKKYDEKLAKERGYVYTGNRNYTANTYKTTDAYKFYSDGKIRTPEEMANYYREKYKDRMQKYNMKYYNVKPQDEIKQEEQNEFKQKKQNIYEEFKQHDDNNDPITKNVYGYYEDFYKRKLEKEVDNNGTSIEWVKKIIYLIILIILLVVRFKPYNSKRLDNLASTPVSAVNDYIVYIIKFDVDNMKEHAINYEKLGITSKTKKIINKNKYYYDNYVNKMWDYVLSNAVEIETGKYRVLVYDTKMRLATPFVTTVDVQQIGDGYKVIVDENLMKELTGFSFSEIENALKANVY